MMRCRWRECNACSSEAGFVLVVEESFGGFCERVPPHLAWWMGFTYTVLRGGLETRQMLFRGGGNSGNSRLSRRKENVKDFGETGYHLLANSPGSPFGFDRPSWTWVALVLSFMSVKLIMNSPV